MKKTGKQKPLFSIVMPCYNVEDYIKDSVDDILEQDCEDWELILVDDSSTDMTGIIANLYSKKEDRITVICHEENMGVAGARNTGIKNAKGEYILMLDPDDRYEKSMLDIYRDTINQTDSDIVVCSLSEEYEIDGQEYYAISHSLPYKEAATREDITRLAFALEAETMYGYPWNKAFRKSLIDEYRLSFPNYSHDEDIVFCINAFMKASKVTVIPEMLYHYKNRTNSKGRLTDRYVPEFFEGKKRRISLLYKQYLKSKDAFNCEEADKMLGLLSSIYCRSLLSAVERKINAHISYSETKRFLRGQMRTKMFCFLKGKYNRKSISDLVYLPLWSGLCRVVLIEAKVISIIKRNYGTTFAKLKQNR